MRLSELKKRLDEIETEGDPIVLIYDHNDEYSEIGEAEMMKLGKDCYMDRECKEQYSADDFLRLC